MKKLFLNHEIIKKHLSSPNKNESLDPEKNITCLHCTKLVNNNLFLLCKDCESVFYCSKECCEKDKVKHFRECERFRKYSNLWRKDIGWKDF